MTRRTILPWLMGLLVSMLLFTVLFLYTDFHYYGSDDTPILRSFMGFEGGVPAQYHLYLHTAFAWLLHGLALLFPGVAWFSILQLILLCFGCMVIVKSCAQCAARHRLSPWVGAVVGTLFLLVFGAFVLCRISYTTTGALLGAAAVAQLMSVDFPRARQGQVYRGIALSIFLLLCCYCLRQISALPPLAFWLLALLTQVVRGLREGKSKTGDSTPPMSGSFLRRFLPLRPLLYSAVICAFCFACFAGVRAAEISSRGLKDYLAWQNARIRLFDYSSFDTSVAPDILEAVNWSPAETKLVANWYFMDQNITTEAFETLYNAQPEATLTSAQRLARVPGILEAFLTANPAYRHACWAMLAFSLLFLLGAARRPGGGWHALATLGALLLGGALLGYLAYQGRLPLRAAASVLFPLGAFLCGQGLSLRSQKPDPLPKARGGTGYTALLCLLLIACLGLCGASVAATAQSLYNEPDPEAEARASIPEDLDAFALDHPDYLIIYDLSLVSDTRLFPDTSNGIPGNLLFWGGYPARSPSWLHQLASYGIDGNTFTAEDFLRENVLVAGTDGEPWQSLMTYVGEAVGPVDWDFYDEYGYIYFYELYATE